MKSLKRFAKRIFKSDASQFLIGSLGGLYARLIWMTARVEHRNLENITPLWQNKQAFIGLIWHSRLLLSRLGWGDRRTPYALISASHDGQILKHAARVCGIRTVHGSSNKGGTAALRELLRLAKQSETLLITPDGPRGPAEQMQLGAIEVARLTNLPIVPFSASTRHGKRLNTWDRFLVPRLFDHVVIVWGQPVYVPRDARPDDVRRDMEKHLSTLQAEADEAVGQV